MKVGIHRYARAEMRAAAQWYVDIQAELQFCFEQNVAACIDRVAAFPRQFPLVADGIRRALVDVFPVGNLLRVAGNKDQGSGDRP